MTPEMRADLVGLRVHFGVSAMEALRGMPAWEYDLLTESLPRPAQQVESEDWGDDEVLDLDGPAPDEPSVPESLKGL